MKQQFVDNKCDDLIVIFCGWGSDGSCFDFNDKLADFLILSDYRDSCFDEDIVKSHKKVSVFAWSLGVWAADKFFQGIRTDKAVAYNGTPFPIDEKFGIPPEIFDGTIANFSERSLYKFRRRMCGVNAAAFFEHLPEVEAPELLDELKCIRRRVQTGGCGGHIVWTEAYYGLADKIFPPCNQAAAWQKMGVPCYVAGTEHYDPVEISRIIKEL